MKDKVKEGLFRVSDYFDDNLAFKAIRQGMIMMIPLLVIGCMALMVRSLPINGYQEFLAKLLDGRVVEFLTFVNSAALNLFAVTLSLTISFSYARLKQKDKGSGLGDSIVVMLISFVSLVGCSGIQYEEFSISSLGSAKSFTALFVALFSSMLYFKMKEKRLFQIRQRGMEADGLYIEAVSGIIPALLIIALAAVMRQMFVAVFHVNSLQELLQSAFDILLGHVGKNMVTAMIMLLLEHGMWFVGIHGSNVLDSVMQENYTAIGADVVYSKTFHDVFSLMGGTGAVLCLVIAILLFSKKNSIRNVASLSLPTVIFNISEIASFGIPVIWNPIFLIPYILVPTVLCLISYAAVSLGIVPHVCNTVEWTTPIILSGYQATGSVRGSILQVVCLVVGICIYLPFLRLFEEWDERCIVKNVQKLTGELQRQEEANVELSLTGRGDVIGGVARVMASDLKDAIREKKIFFLYQPQVDTEGKCIGAEALIRWIHPIAGFIYPPLIIRLAKEQNMLHDIEAYLFDRASYAISEIGKSVSGDFKISVNITNESLAWGDLEKCLDEKVEKYHILSKRLWLEITEQDAMVSSDEILNKIQRLKEKGHTFLIDDFGMGHTSLMYLQTNHFGIVKLDGSLTRDVLENSRNKDIITAITALGKSLHFGTIAEYVETEEQKDKLAELGCGCFQGYLYSKPIPLEELIPWMKNREQDCGFYTDGSDGGLGNKEEHVVENKTMMQYFEWYLPESCSLWDRCCFQAKRLRDAGINMVWLPPAYKGAEGAKSVGYDVYDTYDLGEFDQKGSVATKYGTKEEYLRAVKCLQEQGIEVLADIVLDHMMGADQTENVMAEENLATNRQEKIGEQQQIAAWTKFTFPGRGDKYSDFHWNASHFSGADWDEEGKKNGIFRFEGKEWSPETDSENVNFDYLMGVDLDMDNPETVKAVTDWGKWYMDTVHMDGFRLDAVKHISFTFYKKWLEDLRSHAGRDFFAVGEYWTAELDKMTNYLDATQDSMSLFDVSLHFAFQRAATSDGQFDMGGIFNGTLVQARPEQAVTFVDNHDTQPGQALYSFVPAWFKPIAYALILLRKDGLPCVFYGDYYGIPHDRVAPVPGLKRLLLLRRFYAYGEQQDYFDDSSVVGFVRRGDAEHMDSGMAVVLSDSHGGTKRMLVGEKYAGDNFYDALGNFAEPVAIDKEGYGEFAVGGGSVSVWVTKNAYHCISTEAE